jgi:hypothetical protein
MTTKASKTTTTATSSSTNAATVNVSAAWSANSIDVPLSDSIAYLKKIFHGHETVEVLLIGCWKSSSKSLECSIIRNKEEIFSRMESVEVKPKAMPVNEKMMHLKNGLPDEE